MRFKSLINIDVKGQHCRHDLEQNINITKKELLAIEKTIVSWNPYISKVFVFLEEIQKKQPSQIISNTPKRILDINTPRKELEAKYREIYWKNPHPKISDEKLLKKVS